MTRKLSCPRRGEQITWQECRPSARPRCLTQSSWGQDPGTLLGPSHAQVGCLPDRKVPRKKTRPRGPADTGLTLLSVALGYQRSLLLAEGTERGPPNPQLSPWP